MNPLSCDLGHFPDPPARPRVRTDVYGFGSGRTAKGLMTLLSQSASLPEQWGGTADSKVFKYIGKRRRSENGDDAGVDQLSEWA